MNTIDVVIVAFGATDELAQGVAAAARMPSVGSLTVVDHKGDARTVLGEDVEVMVDASNPGFGAGQNRGAARGAAPYILVLNPDAIVNGEAVAAGTAVLEARPDAAAMQGVVLNASGEPERSQGVRLGAVHLWGRALGLRRLRAVPVVTQLVQRAVPSLRDHVQRIPQGVVDVESLAATALLVRREAFERVGGFDDRYFLYGEDLDLCTRLRRHGWTLLATDAVWARHSGGASSASWFEREVVWWEGTMQFATQWWPMATWLAAIGAAFVRAATLTVLSPSRTTSVWRRVVGRHALTRWRASARARPSPTRPSSRRP